MGYPIVNDPVYNAKALWGENNGKHGVYTHTKQETEELFLKLHNRENWLIENDFENSTEDMDVPNNQDEQADKRKTEKIGEIETEMNVKKTKYEHENETKENKEENIDGVSTEKNGNSIDYTENCDECINQYRDPSPKDLVMYLHAHCYKFGDLEFKTKVPKWAESDFRDNE